MKNNFVPTLVKHIVDMQSMKIWKYDYGKH